MARGGEQRVFAVCVLVVGLPLAVVALVHPGAGDGLGRAFLLAGAVLTVVAIRIFGGGGRLVRVLFAVICVILCFGVGLAILAARNVHADLIAAHTLTLIIGPVTASALGAMLGVAIGTLIRSQIGAIVAVAAYAFTVDAILFASVPSAGRYLPGKASDALAGLPTEHLLTPGVGAAVYGAWTIAFIAMATVRNDRSDV